MKPVQLLPARQKAQSARAASSQGVGVVAVAGVALLGVVGYFEWSLASDLKSRASQLQVQTQEQTGATTTLQQQIAEAGQKDDFTQLAGNVERQVISTLGERQRFAQLAAELANVVPPGAWLTNTVVELGDEREGDRQEVKIEGYAPDTVTIAALRTRLNATESLTGATATSMVDTVSNDGKHYKKFSISAGLATSVRESGTSSDSRLVGGGGVGSSPTGLALEPEPGYGGTSKTTKPKAGAAVPVATPKAAPKPLSALERVARDTGKYGGGS